MNCSFQKIRLGLCAALVLVPALIRAQSISSATTTTPAFGVSWVGAVGDTVVIYGSGFFGASAVNFNGTPAGFSVAGDTQINVSAIPGGATTGLISVTKGANTAYSPQPFQIVPGGPYITGFDPVAGSGGTAVYITGVRLGSVAGTNGILFNGKKAVAATVTSSTSISGTAPPGVTTGPITVMATSGTIGTNTTSSNFFGPSVIVGFSPASGRTGTNVVITGTNFTGATSVLFNGLASTNLVNNNNQITATVPANATTGPITVLAPGGGFATSSNFVVQPTITTFSPTFGATGTRVTINGVNFIGSPTVKFNGVTATGVVVTNATLLGATVPNGATTGPITVTTTNGTATSLTLFYLPPRITGFSPTNSAPGTTVTLNGTNFTDASAVKFNGTTASFFNVSSNSLQATVPGSFITGPLSITTPGGTTNSTGLFYAAPIITSFSPLHGLPGTNVTILGTNFLGTTLVTFNGFAGTGLNVLSNGAVRVTVPAAATTGPISVTAPAGTAVTTAPFYLDYAPVLGINAATPPLVLLSWPGTFYTYTLQASTNLAATSAWSNVLTAPVFSGGSNVVTETNLAPAKFYRLKQ